MLVPRVPIEEQRRYGEAFRKVFEFEDELRNIGIAGRVAAAAIVKGFGTGELTPPLG